MGLGTKIKEIVKSKNTTIKELSEKSGISINTLYSITKRNNKTIRPDILIKIAKALDVSPWEILGIDENDALDNVFNHDIDNMDMDMEEYEIYSEIFKLYGYPKEIKELTSEIANSQFANTLRQNAFNNFGSLLVQVGYRLTKLEDDKFKLSMRDDDKDAITITKDELHTLWKNIMDYTQFTTNNFYDRKIGELNK